MGSVASQSVIGAKVLPKRPQVGKIPDGLQTVSELLGASCVQSIANFAWGEEDTLGSRDSFQSHDGSGDDGRRTRSARKIFGVIAQSIRA